MEVPEYSEDNRCRGEINQNKPGLSYLFDLFSLSSLFLLRGEEKIAKKEKKNENALDIGNKNTK